MNTMILFLQVTLPPRKQLRGSVSISTGEDMYKKCESCVTCAYVKGQGHRGRPSLVSIFVGVAFECIGMDFIELECSKDGNKYALVLQDYLTKWLEVYAVPNRKTETVAKCLLDVVWKHGVHT